jgi:Flp pilus assembly protein TadD
MDNACPQSLSLAKIMAVGRGNHKPGHQERTVNSTKVFSLWSFSRAARVLMITPILALIASPIASFAKELKLTITSVPPGAQVQINGRDAGVTPLTLTEFPSAVGKTIKLRPNYFTDSINENDFPWHLKDPVKITVSKDGCATQSLSLTQGPIPEWTDKGSVVIEFYYYLFSSDTFNITLVCSSAPFQKGNEFFKAKKYPEAISEFAQVLKGNPNDFGALLNTGSSNFEMGEFAAAREYSQKAIQVKPDSFEAWYLQGLVCSKLGEHATAIASLRKAAGLMPAYKIYVALAGELIITNDPTDASAAIAQAIALDPAKPDAYIRAIELNPKDASAHLNLGTAYFHTGQREMAVAEYKTLLTLDPGRARELGQLLGIAP